MLGMHGHRVRSNVKGREMVGRLLLAGALLLGSCGPKALTLPEDPVDRAATCGVIAAQSARLATNDIQAALPFEAMDLCLFGRNHGLGEDEVADALGLAPEDVTRVYRDIDRKREATRYLHLAPQLVEPVDEVAAAHG